VPRISRAVSSAVAASAMALPRLLLILVPSVPSSSGAADSSASGTGNTDVPYWVLNRRAMTRVSSRWGSWSCPTGTRFALQNKMSAAWCTG
jgi:hypothetical protein